MRVGKGREEEGEKGREKEGKSRGRKTERKRRGEGDRQNEEKEEGKEGRAELVAAATRDCLNSCTNTSDCHQCLPAYPSLEGLVGVHRCPHNDNEVQSTTAQGPGLLSLIVRVGSHRRPHIRTMRPSRLRLSNVSKPRFDTVSSPL